MTAEAVVNDEQDLAAKQTLPLLAAIRAAQDGDSRAFDEIMLATERRIALLAWRILGDGEEVKEAVQETYLRVFRSIRQFDATRDFNGWLYRIAVNVCRDLDQRKRRLRLFGPLYESSIPPIASRADADLDAKRDIEMLERALDLLPVKERAAIVLRDIEELSTEEVARVLGSSASTVRVQISSARAKLRKWLTTWKGAAR